MSTDVSESVEIPAELLDAIRSLPAERTVVHCGEEMQVSPLALYATCTHCGEILKLRGFTAHPEVEDVVDAVLEWMATPEGRAASASRMRDLTSDD